MGGEGGVHGGRGGHGELDGELHFNQVLDLSRHVRQLDTRRLAQQQPCVERLHHGLLEVLVVRNVLQ